MAQTRMFFPSDDLPFGSMPKKASTRGGMVRIKMVPATPQNQPFFHRPFFMIRSPAVTRIVCAILVLVAYSFHFDRKDDNGSERRGHKTSRGSQPAESRRSPATTTAA